MAKTDAALEPKFQKVQEAIAKAQALHAIMVGAQVDAEEVERDADDKVAAASKVYDAAVVEAEEEKKKAVELARKHFDTVSAKQANRKAEASKEAEEARVALVAYQEEVRETTGAVIDLMGVVSGGHTSL